MTEVPHGPPNHPESVKTLAYLCQSNSKIRLDRVCDHCGKPGGVRVFGGMGALQVFGCFCPACFNETSLDDLLRRIAGAETVRM